MSKQKVEKARIMEWVFCPLRTKRLDESAPTCLHSRVSTVQVHAGPSACLLCVSLQFSNYWRNSRWIKSTNAKPMIALQGSLVLDCLDKILNLPGIPHSLGPIGSPVPQTWLFFTGRILSGSHNLLRTVTAKTGSIFYVGSLKALIIVATLYLALNL